MTEPSCNARSEGTPCGYCGQPQRGYGAAGDVALCHPDWPSSVEDDCYRMVTVYHRPILDGRTWGASGWRSGGQTRTATLCSPDDMCDYCRRFGVGRCEENL